MPPPLPDKVPNHVAVIMDGNGRWAKARGMPRIIGHKKGADALRTTLTGCRDLGINYMTIYAFSAENWQRPELEVSELMNLLRRFLKKEIATLHQNNIRLRVIGDRRKLSLDIQKQIEEAEMLTCHNTAFHFTVALSYGARQEISNVAQKIALMVKHQQLQPENINETLINSLLYTSDLPEPDLLIRTGGEQRLSNFLLWQSAYTELYFTDVLWPDFNTEHLSNAIAEYASRERRFGKIQ